MWKVSRFVFGRLKRNSGTRTQRNVRAVSPSLPPPSCPPLPPSASIALLQKQQLALPALPKAHQPARCNALP